MRGIEGNFMAQPRVFAHSAKPVTPGSAPISKTDDRGCALYVGTTGNMVVKMEGTHVAVDAAGVEYDTNINIYYNVPGGSFLPILVTHVLESNQEDLDSRVDFWNSKLVEAQEELGQTDKTLAEIRTSLKEAVKNVEGLKIEAEKACEENPNSANCSILNSRVKSATEVVDELTKLEDELIERQTELQKDVDEFTVNVEKTKEAAEDEENQVPTDVENILALF